MTASSTPSHPAAARPDHDAPAGHKALPVGELFETLPLTRRHLAAAIALFVVFAIDAWEMMIIVYTAPLIGKDFKLDPVEVGTLIGAIFVGMGLGALAWGPICERIGRKNGIVWSMALYGVVSLIGSAAGNFALLYAGRFLAGAAAAGMIVATFPLFEELLPVKVRGKYTVYLAAGWPVGILLALGASALFAPLGWRAILAFSSLAALWALVVARWTPESPYWLVGVGRRQEAKEVIAQLTEGRVIVPADRFLTVDDVGKGSIGEIFKGPILRVTLLQIAVNFTFSWGYWGLQTWLPTLLQQRGLSLPQSYGFIALSALCMIPGYVAASFLTARIGRKWTVIGFVGISALAGFGFAGATDHLTLYACNFVLAFFSMGAWGVWDTWLGELYPTRIRVVGYSWGVVAQRIANTAAPSVVGLLVASASTFNMTVGFINAFLLATALLAVLLPETEGRDLH